MPNSYLLYTGNGSTTVYSLVGIDGWINSGFLKVYLNDVLQTTGYTFINMTTVTPQVQFTTAPANGVIVKIQRETPATVAAFKSNVVDFSDSSILTAADLDKVVEGMLHVTQEAEDTVENAIGLTLDQTNWDGDSKRLTNIDDGVDAQDAVTLNQLQTTALYGGAATVPQVWAFTGTGTATYTLNPTPLNLTEEMFIVEVGGVIQNPSTYTITSSNIVFDANVASGVTISIRNFGVARNLIESVSTAMLDDDAVTTAKIAPSAVTATELASNAVTTAKVLDDAITYAKIQNVSATDKILGRSSAGAGNIEEITCTSLGRSFLGYATTIGQRSALGLQGLAVLNEVSNAQVSATANIDFSKLQTVNANSLLGNNTAAGAAATSLSVVDVAALLGYTRWNGNQIGAINMMWGTAVSGTEVLGSSAITNAAPFNPTANISTLNQTLAGAWEISSNNLRPTSATGGTWSIIFSQAGVNWVALAMRIA